MRLLVGMAFGCLALTAVGFWALGEESKPPSFSEATKKMQAGNFKTPERAFWNRVRDQFFNMQRWNPVGEQRLLKSSTDMPLPIR